MAIDPRLGMLILVVLGFVLAFIGFVIAGFRALGLARRIGKMTPMLTPEQIHAAHATLASLQTSSHLAQTHRSRIEFAIGTIRAALRAMRIGPAIAALRFGIESMGLLFARDVF